MKHARLFFCFTCRVQRFPTRIDIHLSVFEVHVVSFLWVDLVSVDVFLQCVWIYGFEDLLGCAGFH